MPIDTSSYPGNNAQPVNALQTYSDILGLQTQRNQQALQQQQMQLNKTAISQFQFDLAKSHLDMVRGALASVLANPDVSQKDVIKGVSDLVNESGGAISTQEASQYLAGMPPDGPELKSWLYQHLLNTMSATEKLNAMQPPPTPIPTQQGTNYERFRPFAPPEFVGSQPQGLAPNTQVIAPDNSTRLLGQQPVPAFQGAAQAPPTAPQAAPQGQSALSGTIGGQNENLAAPQAGTSGAGGPKVGFAPGEAESMGVQAQQSAHQGAALQQAADSVPQQKAILGNLEAQLRNFTSGPNAQWSRVAAAFINTPLQAMGLGSVFNPKAIASQEEFNKQAANLAQAQFQALGGTGTDAKLDSAMHTSPSEALSKQGNQNIINLLKGNADAIAVKNREWQAYLGDGHTPADYGKFSTEFNKQYDPRVFQAQYMSRQQRNELLNGMSKTEQNQFKRSYQSAVDKGWISRPSD